MIVDFRPTLARLRIEGTGKRVEPTIDDVLGLAQATTQEDFAKTAELLPRLVMSDALQNEVRSGDYSSYETSSCVLGAAFTLSDILKSGQLLGRMEEGVRNDGFAKTLLSEKGSQNSIEIMVVAPSLSEETNGGTAFHAADAFTWSGYDEGEWNNISDYVDEEGAVDFEALEGRPLYITTGSLRVRLAGSAYTKYLVANMQRCGGFEFDARDDALHLNFTINNFDCAEADVKNALRYAFDGLMTFHVSEVRSFARNFGQECRKADSGIAAMWWILMDTMRTGRLGCCAVCGRPYVAMNERGKPRRYCSDACKLFAHRNPGKTRSPR